MKLLRVITLVVSAADGALVCATGASGTDRHQGCRRSARLHGLQDDRHARGRAVAGAKHRLTLRQRELKPGNAATHYSRAFPEGGVEAIWKRLQKEYGDEEVHQAALPSVAARVSCRSIRPVRPQRAFKISSTTSSPPGSERLDCDWGHGIITELRGPDIYSFRLPEIQAMRAISRGLMLVPRVAVADRDYPQALNLLRMNYRLGENVAKSPFIVSGLVGLAICGMGNAEVIEVIASPDSPNLYWVLYELPRPIVALRQSIRHELSFNIAIFPFMDSSRTVQHSPKQWCSCWLKARDCSGLSMEESHS